MRSYIFLLLIATWFFSAKAQAVNCNKRARFLDIPGKVYEEEQNIRTLDLIDKYNEIIENSESEKTVIFHFFIDETNSSNRKAEDFMRLLKDSLSLLKTNIEVIFKIQRTKGSVFLNHGENKYSIIHLNALVYSKDLTVLNELFGKGKSARIDTTSNRIKKFNHEFIPIYKAADDSQDYLYLFRVKLLGKGFACNPNEDKEIASMLSLIYKKKCK